MQTELTGTLSPFDLTQAAREFASEVGATAERKKKPISSPGGLRTFFLYVRAAGYVPPHQVSGAITVQTILGAARSRQKERTTNSLLEALFSFLPEFYMTSLPAMRAYC